MPAYVNRAKRQTNFTTTLRSNDPFPNDSKVTGCIRQSKHFKLYQPGSRTEKAETGQSLIACAKTCILNSSSSQMLSWGCQRQVYQSPTRRSFSVYNPIAIIRLRQQNVTLQLNFTNKPSFQNIGNQVPAISYYMSKPNSNVSDSQKLGVTPKPVKFLPDNKKNLGKKNIANNVLAIGIQ